MYKLYYSPGACSMAIHVVLNEIKADFELENVASPKGQPKSASFLAINPLGTVPVLKIDDFILREGGAILLYLLYNHDNNLLPKSGLKKAKAIEWLLFANSTLHPAYSRCFFQHRFLGDEADKNSLYKPSIAQIQKYWDIIEEQLSFSHYICGEDCTVADILLAVIANWSFYFKEPIYFGAKTKTLFNRVISRTSFKQVLDFEGVEYKAGH